MRNSSPALDTVLTGSYSRYLLVDVLHGTDRVAQNVPVESWELTWDLGASSPKANGSLRIVHQSVRGESWVPDGASGVLSPFKATLVLTEVISAGRFEERVQLGFFDVVAVPFAEDVVATISGAPAEAVVSELVTPAEDLLIGPGLLLGDGGVYLSEGRPGRDLVVASIVDVEVESLDGRVAAAGFRSPRQALTSAVDEWRAVGLLPVAVSEDADLAAGVWPAEQGSRLDAVQECARALGGLPVVDSLGQWVLATDEGETVTLRLGDDGTVVELASSLSLDGFFNVVVGDYEDEQGRPIRAVWEAPGVLSPTVMGRELVRYHKSDLVRTQESADAAVASVGALYTSQEVDVVVTCVFNPLVEIGDRCVVDGTDVAGVVQRVDASDDATMRVTVRVRRSW